MSDNTPNDDPLRTPQETADQLRIALSTLVRWRHREKGPKPKRLGYRTLVYPQSAIDAYVRDPSRGWSE